MAERHWSWERYPHRRLRVLLRGRQVRTYHTGSLGYLLRMAGAGRARSTSIVGRCWIELSAEPAVAVGPGILRGAWTVAS